MMDVIRAGGYQALHYFDFAGDGWIEAHCPELEAEIATNVPAFCMVGPPDFFPQVNQRELMLWWQHEVPKAIRTGLWAIPPLALSQMRLAGDITLPVGFSIDDNTVTAIVTQPTTRKARSRQPNGPLPDHYSGMPDSSPGLFDPGWDGSQGIYFTDPDEPLQKFLHGYGLGSPFVEDVKLCAALGSYWPAIAPDGTRNFPPDKFLSGISYPWPTIVPLTDEESGIAPRRRAAYMPWDGVRGPQLRTIDGTPVAAYQDPVARRLSRYHGYDDRGPYLADRRREYKARVLAMEAVYWASASAITIFWKGRRGARPDEGASQAAADQGGLGRALVPGRLAATMPSSSMPSAKPGSRLTGPTALRLPRLSLGRGQDRSRRYPDRAASKCSSRRSSSCSGGTALDAA